MMPNQAEGSTSEIDDRYGSLVDDLLTTEYQRFEEKEEDNQDMGVAASIWDVIRNNGKA